MLVLDDYHVIEAPEVHDGMAFLLEHQPPQLHLVLATRVDPPLPLAQLRARGQLVEVRAADLRFTADEAAAYLNGSMGLGLSADDVAALEGRTEGWIAALQLAALSLQGRDDASAFIAGFAGDDRYIVDYLAEEVLARQTAEVRDFLLQTSILERLTGPLCDAVTGRGRRQGHAGRARAGQPVPRPARRPARSGTATTTCSPTCCTRICSTSDPGEVAELHRRASAWFEAHDDTSQAISHALAGGDTDRAADLMELAMPVMRRERREAELARWMRALPDEVLRTRPVLAVAFVGALAQAGDFDTDRRAARPDRGPGALGRRHAGRSSHRRTSIVVDQDNYRSLPGPHRDVPGRAGAGDRRSRRHHHARARGAGAGAAGRRRWPGRRPARSPGSPRGAPATWPARTPPTPSPSPGSPAPGSSPTSSAAPSRSATSGAPRASSTRPLRTYRARARR